MRDFDSELYITLCDSEWPFEYINHDRNIARAIVFDEEGYYYFVRAERDDDFGKAIILETAGGGVESGESADEAVAREVLEELGARVEVIVKIGVVSDYYNLIHRHNINNYYLCKVLSLGERSLTEDERKLFHLSVVKLTYDEAVQEYQMRSSTPLGRLIRNRELPILKKAHLMLSEQE